MNPARAYRRLLPILAVVALGVVLAVPRMTGPVRWEGTDALFYQAQSLELRGDGEAQARQAVITGPPGRAAVATDRARYPSLARKLADPHWRRYTAPNYRRRWLVPALAALISPLGGERSLELVAGLGYVLVALALYLLLRERFAVVVSLAVTAAFLLWPPLRDNGLVAGTDSWGLALLLVALIFGVRALERERGRGWLIAWVVCLAVLSVTREDGLVAIAAAFWVAVRLRSTRAGVLAGGAVVASLPAMLLLGAPLLRSLAYVEDGYSPPPSTSLSYVVDHYGAAVRSLLTSDIKYPTIQGFSAPATVLWYAVAVILLLGLIGLLRRGGRDPYFVLMRGTLLGGLIYLAVSVNFTSLRLELVFLPVLAAGLAVLLESVGGLTASHSHVTSVDVTSSVRMIAPCPRRSRSNSWPPNPG